MIDEQITNKKLIKKYPNIILDLEQLTYLNSKSIGFIADFFNRLQSKNSKLVLAKAQANVVDILNVVGIDQIVPMTQTLNEAKTI